MHKFTILLILSWLAVGCQPAEEAAVPDPTPRPVKVAKVISLSERSEYSYPAVVLSAQAANLSFRVGGQIIELPVQARSRVKKGDLIAKLDPRDFKSNVDQLKSQITAEQSRLQAMTKGARQEDIAALQAAVAASSARLSAARSQAERVLTQYRKGLAPKEQLDAELATVKASQAKLAADRQALSKGRAGSRKEEVSAQSALIRSLQTQLKKAQDIEADTTLRAPFDGIIAQRLVDNFSNIQPKQTIAIIQNLNRLELSFNVPGPDVARLGKHRERLKLTALLDAIPGQRFPAEIVEFNTQADKQTRTFQGRVAIEHPDGFNILPGMVGQVIVTDESDTGDSKGSGGSLGIPETAVSADSENQPQVWVVNAENKVERRRIKLGEAHAMHIEVLDGLSAGETVVNAGLSAMMPGLEVRPVGSVGQ